MRITLGMDFDMGAYPDSLHGKPAASGEAVLGPIGFLGDLKTLVSLLILCDSVLAELH